MPIATAGTTQLGAAPLGETSKAPPIISATAADAIATNNPGTITPAPATPAAAAAPTAPTTPATPAAAAAPAASSGPPQSITVNGVTLSFNSATQIIDSALAVVGLDPNQVATMPDGTQSTLANWYWNQITSEGLTDSTSIGDMVSDTIGQTGQFQQAFPGYQKALNAGYIQTVTQYVTAEENLTQVMINYGIPSDLITPTTIGNLISGGVSTNELADRLQDGFDAVENAPAEVQNIFGQWFGAQGANALATLFLTPAEQGGQTYPTLEKMLGGAEIAGAAQASNLTISQGLAQRLSDMGQTYSSAQAKFQQLTSQAGLYEQTVGEANKAVDRGTANANAPLTESNQGVEAAFGLSANAQQQVENEELSRENEFKGGGGATTTEAEGYQGIGHAEPY